MCGINGVISLDGREITQKYLYTHKKIAHDLSYRGPDRIGSYSNKTCCIFVSQHNITLLRNNIQPVYSEDEKTIIVFNGEIYNYLELNRDLKKENHLFRSECDSETLLRLYQQYGYKCFEKIIGMFAIAIYDKEKNLLIIGRDRFGEKPIFYTYRDGLFHFCSESNYLIPLTHKKIDDVGLTELLTLGISRNHLISGITRVQPGTYVVATRANIVTREYWKPRFYTDYNISMNEASDQAFDLLKSSIIRMIPRKVGYGAYISGGVDSSIVSLFLHEQSRELDLFTSGLEDLGLETNDLPVDDDYKTVEIHGNELKYADIIASHLATKYHRSQFSVRELIKHLPQMVFHLPGGPIMSTSFPLFYFSALESKDFRVSFSGDGSDEIYGGYQTSNPSSYGDGFARNYIRLVKYFSEKQLEELLGRSSVNALRSICDNIDNDINSNFEGCCKVSDELFNKVRFLQLRYIIGPQILEKADGMTMAIGPTELRLPFLSIDHVEFALKLPQHICRSSHGKKQICINIAKRLRIPSEIIYRKYKQRTSLPYYNLIFRHKAFNQYVNSILNKHSLIRSVLNIKDPANYIYYQDKLPNSHQRAWLLLTFELWLRKIFN